MAILLFHGVNALVLSAQTNVTPAQYLASQPKPNFATNSHLPHLSYFSWPYSYELNVEMASNWGYALCFSSYNSLVNGGLQKDLTNSSSVRAREIALISNNPGKFKLQVYLDRDWPTNLSRGFWVTNSAGLFVDDNTNTWQYVTNTKYTKIVSPAASDADLANEAAFQTAPLRTILSNAPIAIILNGGERDLGVAGFDRRSWQFDPRIKVQAVVTNAYSSTNLTGMSWPRYISNRKAHQLSFLASAVRTALPNRELYIFYNTGNEQSRFAQPGTGGSYWEDVWSNWGWDSAVMNSNTDLPSFEDYYVNPQSWTNAAGAPWNQITDLLSYHLNAVGYNYRLGATNCHYDWVCGGWSNTDTNRLSDISRYTGFLKCIYTAGTVGAVAGYFSFPTGTVVSVFGENGFDGTFPTNTPPHWLLQIMALAHVHALFSHLDNYLYNGDLLSGPQVHVMSDDQPAYEFTNSVADATARVLARKLRGSSNWIVTAWAAYGTNRNVTVNIPTVGALTVLAASSGSVYQVTMSGTNVQQTLLDEYGSFHGIPGPPGTPQVVPQ